MLRVLVLGELAVELDGAPLALPAGRPARVLLGHLALHPGRHARAELAARFWPDVLDESARASLRGALADVRRALGPAAGEHLLATREHAGLVGAWTDAAAAAALASAGDLAAAAALWRGELLAGLEAGEWLATARDEDRARRSALLAALAEAAAAEGDHRAAVARARERVALEPLSEEAHRDLIARLAAAGDRAAAMTAYSRLADRLRTELGIAPSAASRELAAQVRRGGEVARGGAGRDAAAGEPAVGAAGDPALGAAANPALGAAANPALGAAANLALGAAPPLPAVFAARRERSPFVGRERERDRLLGALDSVRDGRRRLVLVAGEPGIGKTRLVAETARRAHHAGATVLAGRCHEEPLAPFAPLVEALRPLGELRPEPAADAGAARLRLFDEVAGVLAAAAARRPVLLVLDDLHWADQATLRLLAHLAAAPEPAALLMLGTYRQTELGRRHPLSAVLADLRREQRSERLALTGLDAGAATRLIGGWVGSEAGSELVARVLTETEGNPFFIEEVLRDLVEDGALIRRDGRWRADGPLSVPESVREVIGRRVERLSDTAVAVLEAAAACGREFDLPVLAASGVMEQAALLDGLEEAERAYLVRPAAPLGGRDDPRAAAAPPPAPLGGRDDPRAAAAPPPAPLGGRDDPRAAAAPPPAPLGGRDDPRAAAAPPPAHHATRAGGRWAFSHALVREALYDDLPSLRRARLHAAVADGLVQTGGSPAEAAFHAYEAAALEGPARAIALAEEAAAEALAGLAYEAAAAHLARALQALELEPAADPLRRADLLLARGDALARAADPEALAAFAAARELARAAGDAERLARAALGACGVGVTIIEVDLDRAALLEEAIAALGAGGRAPALRARLLARLAIELAYAPGRDRSGPLSDGAVATAREAGDPDALLAALNARHVALWHPDGLDERLALADEMIALAAAHDRPEAELQGRNWRAVDLWEASDIPAFEAELERHAALADALRLPAFQWYAPMWRAALAVLRGEHAAARPLIERAVAIGSHAGDENAALGAAMLGVSIGQQERRFEDYDFDFVTDKIENSPAGPAYRSSRAWTNAELGRVEEARADLEWLAADGFARLPFDFNWLSAVGELAEAIAILGDGERAEELYALVLPYADRSLVAGRAICWQGSMHHYLGRLAATSGRLEDAIRHFEAALAEGERTGGRAWQVQTRARLADALAAAGDPEAADRMLAAARAEAEALGLGARAIPRGAGAARRS
jgi:DNA-binding SARP family transcriptional activator